MVAVGLWGAFLGMPAIWILPVVFPVVMALGGALGVCPPAWRRDGHRAFGCRALFAAAAFAIGFDSGPAKGSTPVVIKTLLGTWLMVVFLLFDVAYYTSLATRNHWPKVGVRILGSWIIAISLLMLAFSMI